MTKTVASTGMSVALAAILLLAQPAAAQEIIVTNIAQPQCLSFSKDMARGTRSADVVALQKFLVRQGYLGGDMSNATGYFGPLTEGSLRAFQASRSIPQSGRTDLVTRAAIMMASCGVLGYELPNYIPLFRGVFGPNSIKVGEAGQWTAIVNNEYSKHFTVSVSWGDGALSQAQTMQMQGSHAVTLPHTFMSKGLYKVIFSVANAGGKINTSQITVEVTE